MSHASGPYHGPATEPRELALPIGHSLTLGSWSHGRPDPYRHVDAKLEKLFQHFFPGQGFAPTDRFKVLWPGSLTSSAV